MVGVGDPIGIFAGLIVDYGPWMAALPFIAAVVYLVRGITGWGYGTAAGKDPSESYFGRLGQRLSHNWGRDISQVSKISMFEYSEFKKLLGEIDGFADNDALNSAWRHQKRRDMRAVAKAHTRIADLERLVGRIEDASAKSAAERRLQEVDVLNGDVILGIEELEKNVDSNKGTTAKAFTDRKTALKKIITKLVKDEEGITAAVGALKKDIKL